MGEREYKCGPLSYRRMNPYGSVVKSHNIAKGVRSSWETSEANCCC